MSVKTKLEVLEMLHDEILVIAVQCEIQEAGNTMLALTIIEPSRQKEREAIENSVENTRKKRHQAEETLGIIERMMSEENIKGTKIQKDAGNLVVK